MRTWFARKLGVYTRQGTLRVLAGATPICRALQQAFPGSEWVPTDGSSREQPGPDSLHPGTLGYFGPDSIRPSPASTVPVASSQPSTGPLPPGGARAVDLGREPARAALAVIGGTKYDSAALERWLRSLPQDTVIVTGNGRGAEQRVRELGAELGLRVDVPALHPERYGRKALDIQVSYVMSMTAGDIVVIGAGSRPSKAREWFKRARWGRELVEVAASEPSP